MEQLNVRISRNADCSVIIKKDIFSDEKTIRSLFEDYNRAMIITDDNVRALHLEKILKSINAVIKNIAVFCLYPKETSKTISTAEQILYRLSAAGYKKDDIIISLGGGMVSDIAGFCASIYKRGMHLAHIPTTILAQIDASIGGKTGVNTALGKNAIGSVYHAESILIDEAFLSTLDDSTYTEGFAEIIKYALIGDAELFKYLEDNTVAQIKQNITYIISKCVKHKVNIICQDEQDRSIRLKLNFGHTIAHAIEKYYDYIKYSHTQAVAIGMYNTLFICEREKLCAPGATHRTKNLLEKFGLEYKMPQINKDDFYKIMINDKKSCSKGIRLCIVTDIGNSEIVCAEYEKIKMLIDKYSKEI